MNGRVPGGFRVAALFAAGLGVMMLAAVLSLDVGDSYQPGMVILNRALAGGLAALAGVAAEALWCARRWAYPATLALALACAAAVVVALVAVAGVAGGLLGSFFILILSAMIVLPIVLYVRDRSAALFGHPRPRVPRPAVPPPPPNRRPQPWW